MNWETIKYIYCHVLIYGDSIEYLGKDKYKLISYYPSGEKHWETEYKNGQLHGKDTWWLKNGEAWLEDEYKNGERIE